MPLRASVGTVLALAAFALAGCGDTPTGPKAVKVQGAVTKGGKPWSVVAELGGAALPPGDPGGAVIFVSKAAGAAKGGGEFPATLDPAAGTFKVNGAEGKGIPAGDYDAVVYLGSFGGVASAAKKGAPPPSMHGREVGRKAVTVTEAGPNDVAIDLPAK